MGKGQKAKHYYAMGALFLVALVIYIGLDYLYDLPPTALEFKREVVRAEPGEGLITFSGEYEFLSNHSRKQSYKIGFPIYRRSGMPEPLEIKVLCQGTTITHTVLSQGIEFELPVRGGEEVKVRIKYTIAAPDYEAEYLTMTANLWSKPVSYARFEVPEGVRSNYHEDGEISVVFRPFQPKANWKLEWREGNEN
jgi:hypothetical protein